MVFTDKGGVGKTTVACGVALRLAEQGAAVLLVSTDPASNLDDVLGVIAGTSPIAVPDVDGLFVMNIDPDAAAATYRERVLASFRGRVPDEELGYDHKRLVGLRLVDVELVHRLRELAPSVPIGDDEPLDCQQRHEMLSEQWITDVIGEPLVKTSGPLPACVLRCFAFEFLEDALAQSVIHKVTGVMRHVSNRTKMAPSTSPFSDSFELSLSDLA